MGSEAVKDADQDPGAKETERGFTSRPKVLLADRVKLNARGVDVEIGKGDQISWKNPVGLGGITATGEIQGIQVDEAGGPRAVAILVYPSAELLALVKDIGIPAKRITHRTGLDGNGGLVLVTGEAFSAAVYRGELRKVEPEKASEP